MTTTTTLPSDVTSGHVVNATTRAWSEEDPDDGELLWVWYLVFTVVLLGLILASFVRFHYRRVQQQRQRLDAEMTYGVKNRRHGHVTPVGHVTPSPSNSNVAVTPAAVVNLDTQRLLAAHHNDVRGLDREVAGHRNRSLGHAEVMGHPQRSRGREDGDVKRAPVVYTFNANGELKGRERSQAVDLEVKGQEKSAVVYAFRGRRSRGHKVSERGDQTDDLSVKSKRKRSPVEGQKVRGQRRSRVVYTFNANGSMVDVRCEQMERCNTFRFDHDYDAEDPQHIHLPSSQMDDVEGFRDVDELRRKKSCLRNAPPELPPTSPGSLEDGELPQSNHHPPPNLSQLHLLPQHHHQQPRPRPHQHHPRQRLSPVHHRYRHRQKTSSADTRTSLLYPSRLGRQNRAK